MEKKKQAFKNGFAFKPYELKEQSPFEKLFDIFQEIITHTSGDLDEALDWMKELDKEYHLTDDDYTLDDFVEDLKKKGYIREEIKPDGKGGMAITAKTEQAIRKRALEQIFGKLKRSGAGNHRTNYIGPGDEHSGEFRKKKHGIKRK